MIIKTEKSNAIINFLEKDLLINLNIIGIIENVLHADIYVDDEDNPKGVFIKKDYFHYIYSREDSFIDEVCNTFFKDGFYGFSGVEESIAKKIKEKFEVQWNNPCDLYYMPEENLDLNLIKNEVKNIDIKDVEIIDNYYEYRHPGSIDVIKKDIEERPSSAIYIDDEIACWVLVHTDNSMGIMYTKEEHRRKGYAVDVTIDLTSKLLKNGKTPYLQIVNRNSMSPGLAEKCGFVPSGVVEWFGIIEGTPKELIQLNNQIRDQFLKDFRETSKSITDDYDGMYLFTSNLNESYMEVPDFIISEVEGLDMINTWCEIVCKGFDIIKENMQSFREKISEIATNNNYYKFYIGYLNGRPVSSISVLKHKNDSEVSGIYFLSTLPHVRNQDIGTKTLLETLKQAKENGCEVVLLQTPLFNSNMFEKIGFKKSHTESK